MPWTTWRLYDLALLGVALYTWSFVVRMRGLSLIDARLAQIDEAERLAEEQRVLAARKDQQARQKAFFLNALSHDLRAPLNIVALNAHLLKTTVREQADVESAKLIIENAVAAGNLVAKALELAKADAEDRNDMDVIRLPDLLHQVVRRFAPIAAQKGLYLRVGATTEIEVLTDGQKLDRVITNLVDNAIKFTETGGVTIDVDRAEELVLVRVCDTGVGVPQQSMPYVFDEFYQADDPEVGRRQGFGMGLAICRLLARQLGGDVRLVSTGAEGSCFELSFLARSNRGVAHESDRLHLAGAQELGAGRA
jgi:signal transduction histidine kinase